MQFNQDFDKTGSILKTQSYRTKTKRTQENIEKSEQMTDNHAIFPLSAYLQNFRLVLLLFGKYFDMMQSHFLSANRSSTNL